MNIKEENTYASIVVIYCIMWLTRTSRKKKIDSSRICSSVYIISKKKRPVHVHAYCYLYCYMVVFYGLPGPQDKDDSVRRIWIWILDIIFSHVGNERACALHPGIIKGCVQRDQFHKWLLLASCFNRYFLSLVANKKLAL